MVVTLLAEPRGRSDSGCADRPGYSVEDLALLCLQCFPLFLGDARKSLLLVQIVSNHLGVEALRRVELHFKGVSGGRVLPPAVDALIAGLAPGVAEAHWFDAGIGEPLH